MKVSLSRLPALAEAGVRKQESVETLVPYQ